MTVRLLYRHYCDRCHRVIHAEEYELARRMEIPHPARHEYAGMDLCNPCMMIVESAVREVMRP